MIRRKDMAGKTIDKWYVVEFADVIDGRAYWLCECQCGHMAVVRGDNLRRGCSSGCKACSRKDKV